MYPVYQLPIFIVSPDCLLHARGHALIVVLARVPSQLVCDGVASPVVFGDLAVILILLRLMSWDQFHVYGFSTSPRLLLPKLPQIPVGLVDPSRWFVPPVLDPLEPFNNRLIVNGNRDGSRSVGGDDGGGELHPCGVVSGGTHGLLSVCLTALRFRELHLDVVQRVRARVSVGVDDANPSVRDPRYPRQKD